MTGELTREDLENMEKDVAAIKQAASEKEKAEAAARAREEGRKEAEREAELKRKLDEQEAARKALEAKLADQEKKSQEQLASMQAKIDEMATSKAVVGQNPLGTKPTTVDNLTSDQIDKIEQRSAIAFFGPDYERMLNQG